MTMDIESPGRTEHDHDHAHSHTHHDGEPLCPMETNSKSTPKNQDPDVLRRKSVLRRLTIASVLCTTFLLVEVIGGLLAGSLAVLSDAAHLLADLASFAVAIAAAYLASLPATETHTYGLKRTEALAALFSMVSLAIISAGLAVEAIRRLWPFAVSLFTGVAHDVGDPVDGKLMSIIAAIGVGVNVCLALVLGEHHVHLPGADHGHDHSHDHGHGHGHGHGHAHGHGHGHGNGRAHGSEDVPLCPANLDHSESYGTEAIHSDEVPPLTPTLTHDHGHFHVKEQRNLNLHAAYLHVLGDLAQSVAVLVAGLIIWAKPTYAAADPICTILFAILVFYSTIAVIRSSISVLLEEVPPNISWDEVHSIISSIKGVSNVHDLHIWSISHGETALSVHVNATHPERALVDIHEACRKYKVKHSTVQVQPFSVPECITCGEGMNLCM